MSLVFWCNRYPGRVFAVLAHGRRGSAEPILSLVSGVMPLVLRERPKEDIHLIKGTMIVCPFNVFAQPELLCKAGAFRPCRQY